MMINLWLVVNVFLWFMENGKKIMIIIVIMKYGVVEMIENRIQMITVVDKRISMAERCMTGLQDNNSKKDCPELFWRQLSNDQVNDHKRSERRERERKQDS